MYDTLCYRRKSGRGKKAKKEREMGTLKVITERPYFVALSSEDADEYSKVAVIVHNTKGDCLTTGLEYVLSSFFFLVVFWFDPPSPPHCATDGYVLYVLSSLDGPMCSARQPQEMVCSLCVPRYDAQCCPLDTSCCRHCRELQN